MSKKNQEYNISETIDLAELNERERMVVQLFRLLDERSQKDVIRFIDAFLTGA